MFHLTMEYLFAYFFISFAVSDICRPRWLLNILNTMEMNGRVEGEVVVNDKLEIVSTVYLWRE